MSSLAVGVLSLAAKVEDATEIINIYLGMAMPSLVISMLSLYSGTR
jgi:hypothetical protein